MAGVQNKLSKLWGIKGVSEKEGLLSCIAIKLTTTFETFLIKSIN